MESAMTTDRKWKWIGKNANVWLTKIKGMSVSGEWDEKIGGSVHEKWQMGTDEK